MTNSIPRRDSLKLMLAAAGLPAIARPVLRQHALVPSRDDLSEGLAALVQKYKVPVPSPAYIAPRRGCW
jgi:hypothetical protein